ncbi:MAG: hypothetical protein MR922_04700 [Lachnospiraceae bacterium]|nr:hypothetical protein [Lachnospiraceae bacterium]
MDDIVKILTKIKKLMVKYLVKKVAPKYAYVIFLIEVPYFFNELACFFSSCIHAVIPDIKIKRDTEKNEIN